MKHRQLDLESFLEELPTEAAAKARAAAARIDELEDTASRIGGSDQTYLRLFVVAGVLFAIAAVILFSGHEMFRNGIPSVIDVTVLLMAGMFPAMVLIYSLKMSERTKIDRQQFEIMESYFLPYGAIYLPPGPDRARGVVSVAESGRGWTRDRIDEKKVKRPGWYW